ncbi:hypothetical protein Gpo141_00009072 [Globisporangium polare]
MKETHDATAPDARHQRSRSAHSPLKSALRRPLTRTDDSATAGATDEGDVGPATATRPEKKNEGAEDTITVLAHVKEKIIPVHCGFGTQQVLWLAHVAVARYDEESCQGWLELGVPTKIVKDGAKHALKPTDLICDVLANSSHVYISTSLG